MRNILTRDHFVWTLTFVAAVCTFLVTSTTALVPPAHVDQVRDIAALCGFLSGWFSLSPLPKLGAPQDNISGGLRLVGTILRSLRRTNDPADAVDPKRFVNGV